MAFYFILERYNKSTALAYEDPDETRRNSKTTYRAAQIFKV